MSFLQIALLALVQGFAELLPISSSAHVVVAEKLMGLNPTDPRMTLLLVALHTGTMFSVLVYFGGGWKERYFDSRGKTLAFVNLTFLATLGTALTGLTLMEGLKKIFKVQVEDLFGNLPLIALSLLAAGILILSAARRDSAKNQAPLTARAAWRVGLVQGLCLPFRGFSRSGATISTALLSGLNRQKAEDFSFALAVLLTPAVLLRELLRLLKAQGAAGLRGADLAPDFAGLLLSFGAGLLALRWLSGWLSRGRWGWFGLYCLAAAAAVGLLAFLGRFNP
ncbi:MAG TPA: undecaprenyl-diphosphate phosphatase [bacterium]|nr:undecaprenyl-diphosphate phosphatase [bacterium]